MASSLSVWYLSLENHVWSWVCGSSTTNTPTLKFPLLVLYEPREPHPEMRNVLDAYSSNWKNGCTIWTFHWRWCWSTKNITISAFIGNNTAESAQRTQIKKTISKINSRLLMIIGHFEGDVCPWCDCQGERLPLPFPTMHWGVWGWGAAAKDIWNNYAISNLIGGSKTHLWV